MQMPRSDHVQQDRVAHVLAHEHEARGEFAAAVHRDAERATIQEIEDARVAQGERVGAAKGGLVAHVFDARGNLWRCG